MIGDLQSTFDRVVTVLKAQDLIGRDGWLRADCGLVAVGDYFDFPTVGMGTDRDDGALILAWLAAHDPRQVVLLAGNHDLARVLDFIAVSDADFLQARIDAGAIGAAKPPAREALLARFHERWPMLSSPEKASRDYARFTTTQRTLVQRLLLEDRLRLAATVTLTSGVAALVTHAGVTQRELILLGYPEVHAPDIADALNRFLADAVDRVREPWQRQQAVPLDLSPLHIQGRAGREGGGLLYHRPAQEPRERTDVPPLAPRRFAPADLPAGLVQVCGHTQHAMSRRHLAPLLHDDADGFPAGAVRTLLRHGDALRYQRGVHVPHPDGAALIMIDGGIHRTEPGAYEVLAVRA